MRIVCAYDAHTRINFNWGNCGGGETGEEILDDYFFGGQSRELSRIFIAFWHHWLLKRWFSRHNIGNSVGTADGIGVGSRKPISFGEHWIPDGSSEGKR